MSLIADGAQLTKPLLTLLYARFAERAEAAGMPLDTGFSADMVASGLWTERVKFDGGSVSNFVDALTAISGVFCDANGDFITLDSPPAANDLPDRRRFNWAYDALGQLNRLVYYPDYHDDVNKVVSNDYATPAELALAKADFLAAAESSGGGGLAMGGSSTYLGDFAPGYIPPDPAPPPDPRYTFNIFGYRERFYYTVDVGMSWTGRIFVHAALNGQATRLRIDGTVVDVHGPDHADFVGSGGSAEIWANALPYEDATALAALDLAAGFDMGTGASAGMSDYRLVVTPAWTY